MRSLGVLPVESVTAPRRESLCFLSGMKSISVELYTRIARFAHESCPIFRDRRAGSSNAREETSVTRRNRRCHESRPCSELPTLYENTVRVRFQGAPSNPLIMNPDRRVPPWSRFVTTFPGTRELRSPANDRARAQPGAVIRTPGNPCTTSASGVEKQRLRRRDRACSWSMSDGGIFAGERDGSEPPRRLSGGAGGHCRSTACRARCRRACRERRRPGRARRARRSRRIGDAANDR